MAHLLRDRADRARAGTSLIEVMVVLAILSIAGAMFTQTMSVSRRLDPVGEETAIAAEGARTQIERMRNHPYADVFRLYNADPSDDPRGPGTAPGPRFDVEGLSPPPGAAAVGEVIFPTVGGQLREDALDLDLCLPRDLDGDGAVDALDHAADAIVLPFRVRVAWKSTGRAGQRSLTLYAMFSAL